MQHSQPTHHCPALTREQRAVLDEAAREYGLPWRIEASKHNKVYLGNVLVTVLSLSRGTNRASPHNPAIRLRKQIEHAMTTQE